MAPELAILKLGSLAPGLQVLDPMTGSGTVARHAVELGHEVTAFDVDPLAVLMTRVWTTPIQDEHVAQGQKKLGVLVDALDAGCRVPWIDDDPETKAFVDYWFGEKQQAILRQYAIALQQLPRELRPQARPAADVLRIGLSRIIITKDRGASLARDVSHSRPHRVATSSDYDVDEGFRLSMLRLRKLLVSRFAAAGEAKVCVGDSRSLTTVDNSSVDFILTSPPYLNAIDYLRGHRLSLVWLGHSIPELRQIRSGSIGADRAPDNRLYEVIFEQITEQMGTVEDLPTREQAVVHRYASDLYRMLSETARVLKRGCEAVLVVGNSCLRGIFISNAKAVMEAGRMVGLDLVSSSERELPDSKRYLPTTGGLAKRMRTEAVLTFRKP